MPKITPAEIQKHRQLLEATLTRIEVVTTGQDETALSYAPDKKTWSVVEILAHLRGCADLWTYSIYATLTENEPTLPLIDERNWAKTVRYATLTFSLSFQTFQLQRHDLLRVLHQLPEEAFHRSGMIGDRRHTVFSQMRRMALHEAEHCDQIEALFKIL